MSRTEFYTKMIRHLLGIIKLLAIYGEVEKEFPKLFPPKEAVKG